MMEKVIMLVKKSEQNLTTFRDEMEKMTTIIKSSEVETKRSDDESLLLKERQQKLQTEEEKLNREIALLSIQLDKKRKQMETIQRQKQETNDHIISAQLQALQFHGRLDKSKKQQSMFQLLAKCEIEKLDILRREKHLMTGDADSM